MPPLYLLPPRRGTAARGEGRLIYFVAYRTPQGRHRLPFVDQPGCLPFQHRSGGTAPSTCGSGSCQQYRRYRSNFCCGRRSTGLAALFWPLHANGTEGRQVFFHLPVDNAGVVDLFLHGSHFNDSMRSLHTTQLNFDLTQFICFGSRTITLRPNFCA